MTMSDPWRELHKVTVCLNNLKLFSEFSWGRCFYSVEAPIVSAVHCNDEGHGTMGNAQRREAPEGGESPIQYDADTINNRILTIRGQNVIPDSDLAEIYRVQTKVLNQQAKRNSARFPDDFAFTLSQEEWEHVRALRSQNVTLKRGQHRKYPPRVFTEHGVIMAANVLNCISATEMSVFVVRAFVRMRAVLTDTQELARKLAILEQEIKDRLNTHDSAIVEVLSRFMDIIDPPAGSDLPESPARRIGFSVHENQTT